MQKPSGHWVWVTTPEYYAEEDGSDRRDLDPRRQGDSDGWWTCHKDTCEGDLALLYRAKQKMDLGYLIRAGSPAYSIADDKHASEHGWDYGCNYQVLYKFEGPITLADLRADPYVAEWGALRGNFQRRAYGIPDPVWERLLSQIKVREPAFARFMGGDAIDTARKRVLLEKEVEDRIEANPAVLAPFGLDLQIRGRQVVCKGHGGRIDLLAFDRKRKRTVIIELKTVRAGQNTLGQIATYMGWAEGNLTKGKPVDGVVIARGFDNRFLSAAKTIPRITSIELSDLGFVD